MAQPDPKKVAQRKMSARGKFVPLKELPAPLVRALASNGFKKRDIEVIPSTREEVGHSAFEGNRPIAVSLDIDTGRVTNSMTGQWGGGLPGSWAGKGPSSENWTIPRNGALIVGESGGRGSFMRLYVHPDSIDFVTGVSVGAEVKLTDDEKHALASIKGWKSGYRKELFERQGLGEYGPNNPLVKALTKKGLLMVRGRAVSVTTQGKNVFESLDRRYKKHAARTKTTAFRDDKALTYQILHAALMHGKRGRPDWQDVIDGLPKNSPMYIPSTGAPQPRKYGEAYKYLKGLVAQGLLGMQGRNVLVTDAGIEYHKAGWRAKRTATSRTKTAGEVRFIKDHGANHGKASWGWEDYRMTSPQKRQITSDFDFKVHRVPALARVLRSTVASLGHAMKGYETFCKLKSADISPDGALGGRGYIMKISDMRRQYVNILEALSTMSDTFDDEIRAPHWKVLMGRNTPEGEEAQEIVNDAQQIKEDPEAWATEQEQEMDIEKDEDGTTIRRVASTNKEGAMRTSVANRYLESLDRERLRDE